MRPRIFIGCSTEALDIAHGVQENLDRYADCHVWDQAVMELSRSTMENLMTQLDQSDYAIFVFSADDVTKIRDSTYSAVRDNVLYEFGLFTGRLGRERTYFILPRDARDLRMPTDLLGLTAATYDAARASRSAGETLAALGPACNQIRRAITAVSTQGAILASFPRTNDASQADLLGRLRQCREKFNAFGLTRNFYMGEARSLIEDLSRRVPVKLFLMDPESSSRADRYRIEPTEAAMRNPNVFEIEILRPLAEVMKSSQKEKYESNSGLQVFFYNFPCSFAIEEIDDVCRVMLYGHAKRGTEGPIFIFREGNSYYEYFISQIRWLEDMALNGVREPWRTKGIEIQRFDPEAVLAP